ncbi:UBA/THIF-type NAD/FAD binding domain-containing protein (plasmid) [Rhizobium phaseoli]|uniref:ThiF family adenylyltransferase n=1 Tax=Rhizobium phaseoli TaxID=396 RepID=UPI0007F0B149|nr:ThiF family adenylyltransferase [Rhizobium phaseoli]ANL68575.1 UBA/THIF-type NAD/FAD binding domain-containing protein [Rhizobium phaseoli]ANL81384.1 UBA/THIF-type NAD/FAD binding domain-containing protein [Rhizobium phaseoli]
MPTISADELHRTAKYFMDSGKASSHAEAMEILESFRLSILVAPSIGASALEQTALLTLVNIAARTFLGGVEVVGLPECIASTPLYAGRDIRDVVVELGGKLAVSVVLRPTWPIAVIGDVAPVSSDAPQWRLTWSGWRGGVTPAESGRRLDEAHAIGLAPVLASAACAAEAFSYLSKTHPLAGRRALGMSLWNPTDDWLGNINEPELSYLPSSLWLIGLGNLGQAFVWALASLDFGDGDKTELLLQDVDRIAISNHSTSLLSFPQDVGTKKTRVVARWLEQRGFETDIEERLFGEHTRRAASEPRVALCGVDNPQARAALENAGFGLVVEAGLGAGLDSFLSIGLHTFPASRTAASIWSKQVGQGNESFRGAPAYGSLAEEGMDECGLIRLASRTIAVPFVGLLAGCLVIAEVLRRLHGGTGTEVLSVSALSLGDVELVPSANSDPYAFGFVEARND